MHNKNVKYAPYRSPDSALLRRLRGRYTYLIMKKFTLIFSFIFLVIGYSSSSRSGKEEVIQKEEFCYTINECAIFMHDSISHHWNKPYGYDKRCEEVKVKLALNSKKELSDIEFITKSSRDVFNRSIALAIRKASPFVSLNGLDENVYNSNFSNFILVFEPICN